MTLLPSCSVSPDVAKMFNEKIGPLIGMKLSVAPAPPTKAATTNPEEEVDAPDNRAMNADFIREAFRVVLLRDLRSRDEFDKYTNVMDQGGHYEAIYNGLVYAAEYREKEKGVSPVSSLKAYAQIMAQITLDQKYDPLKVHQAEEAEAAAGTKSETGEVTPPQPSEAERIALIGTIERDAITQSTFWMKRRLGEEILKTIDLKKEYKEKLATWYARFTVFMNKRGVDFGLPQRNKPEEYFHYKWALDADEDRLKWECLNRAHKTINAGAGLREPIPEVQTQQTPQAVAKPAQAVAAPKKQ